MYRDTRTRLTALFGQLSEAELEATVPATPAWTVADIARHLAGVADDVVNGRIEGAATDPWTDAQVQARRHRPVPDVLAEWGERAVPLEESIDAFGPAGYRLVIDCVTHEQDVRGAVGRPGGRDTTAAAWSLQQLVFGAGRAISRAGLPPLRIRSATDEWLLGGDAEPVATLEAEPYELLRALIGRRSRAQLRAYRWDGDPEPYLDVLPVFPAAATDIVE